MAEFERPSVNEGNEKSVNEFSRLAMLIIKSVQEGFPEYKNFIIVHDDDESGVIYFLMRVKDGQKTAESLRFNYDRESFGAARGRVRFDEDGQVDYVHFNSKAYHYCPPPDQQVGDETHFEWHYDDQKEGSSFPAVLEKALSFIHEIRSKRR